MTLNKFHIVKSKLVYLKTHLTKSKIKDEINDTLDLQTHYTVYDKNNNCQHFPLYLTNALSYILLYTSVVNLTSHFK